MKKTLVIVGFLCLSSLLFAQNKMLSSKQLMSRSLYPQEQLEQLQFVGNSNSIAYVTDTNLCMGAVGKTKIVLTPSILNRLLANAAQESINPRYFSYVEYQFLNENELLLTWQNKLMRLNLKDNSLTVLTQYAGRDYSLDFNAESGNYAYTIDNNLFICANGNEYAIKDDNRDIVYGQSVHRNEFGISKGTFWSPKGNKLAFYRMDQTMVTDYPMVNTATRIATPAPFKYPMAGMKSHEVTVGVYNPSLQKVIYLQTRKDTSVAEREMFLTNISWSPDEEYVYIAKVNRQQNHLWLERYNANTGALDKVLFEEQNERYVEPCEGLYFVPSHPDQFLWFSMRDGYKHLYLYNTNGQMLRQVTQGNYEVETFIRFDEKGENIFIGANRNNLAGRGAFKVSLKTGEMTALTPDEGTHEVQVSASGNLVIDKYSSNNIPLRAQIIKLQGKKIQTTPLYDAPNPLSDYAMPTFTLGTIKAADGTTDLYYRLITPPNMDSSKVYPTLVYVYGGPHSQLVTDSWLLGGNLYFTFLAQQGYVIFTLDNRGTDNRGFAFESCTHRQLGTIEMADQMEGVKFLKSLPFVDQERMGVEGWSFGGFMTITMKLAHPVIFKVGCAGGPVIDWKWYEVMYGERYMDMPDENPEGYKNASLVNKAKDLQGRLLVIHGAEDNTVVWQNSIEFIEACIKSGRLVDYFVYPHHEHNVRGIDRVHLYEKMFDYYETFLKP